MKQFLIAILSLLISLSLYPQDNSKATKRQKQFNVKSNLAIQGYDPVAYFKQGKAVKGKKEFAVNAEGIIYHCSSAANKELFLKNYSAYEPQYGGWCAYAMGNSGEKVEINPETFKIIDGKLYLFYNAYFNNTLNSWNKNEKVLKAKADSNWQNFYK
ncbi:MAG: YHS domain-containing (seleno)protein [bacterium]|nr:YHS domain-containing (seleno)protein [bacterium]